MTMRRRMAAALVGLLTMTGVVALSTASPAGAAGMTTHAWMAESAIDLVQDPALQALLKANQEQVRAGARFPDGGYGPGNVYGEEAHWQRFFDVHADNIRAKETCGDLTAPTGPCAAQIAHLLGAVGHGAGDEVWDWLFEPNSPDLDEYYLPEDLSAFQDGGGQELVMDLVAIGVHQRPGGTPPALPFPEELLASLEESGQQGTTLQQLETGQQYIGIVYQAESYWATVHLDGVLENMPWMSENLVTGPGGVDYAARAIAAQWESMWGRLTGDQPATEISVTYPADGQTGIPTGWVRPNGYQPGSAPGRGGARTRIAASVSYALPYRAPGGPGVSDQLPAGAMTLTERDTGTVIPALGGFPRAVPYGADAGEHTIGFQPATDLQPCTWYRVDVTSSLLDANGEAVVPHAWEFRTAQDAAGTACVDPVDADEEWIRATYRDALGRGATDAEVAAWKAQLDAGLTPGRFANAVVGSAEHRRVLVGELFETLLDRAPDSAGRDYWAEQLRTVSLTRAASRILGTPEAFARLGGTNDAFVTALYAQVLQRTPTAEDLAFWSGRLAAGTPRGTLALSLLSTPEVREQRIAAAYDRFLQRDPAADELAFWDESLRASDERPLMKAILAGDEYRTHVQPPA